MISCLHHFEIFTKSSRKLINYFSQGLKFNLIYHKQTKSQLNVYDQYLLNCNSINFLITDVRNGEKRSTPDTISSPHFLDNELNSSALSRQLFETSLAQIERSDAALFRKIVAKEDCAFNVAFQVCNLDRILANCERYSVSVLKPKHTVYSRSTGTDDSRVDCALIKSCVDGVVHTLIEKKSSSSSSSSVPPPLEEEEKEKKEKEAKQVGSPFDSLDYRPTHFDHLTFATYKNKSPELIEWYQKIFNMKRIRVDQEKEEGLLIKTGKSGMNLKVVNYWFCAENGVFVDTNNNNSTNTNKDFKLVIAEPLDDDEKRNQISMFLDANAGPGIQHIGLHTPNIVRLVESTKDGHIAYYETPKSYYNEKEKVREINDCGLKLDELKRNHVLLDAEFKDNKELLKSSTSSSQIRLESYLLQVFTKPLFEKNTLFLEFIQRVGKASGFGAANIIALWKAVENDFNKQSAASLSSTQSKDDSIRLTSMKTSSSSSNV